MVSQKELDSMYMEMAYVASRRSHAQRRKVGAILVTPDGGRFEGINGMPAGMTNECENMEYRMDSKSSNVSEAKSWVEDFCVRQQDGTWLTPRHNIIREVLVTKPEVLHAESNAITKVARSTSSSLGSTLYSTLSPCLECAKMIIQAGVKRVVFSEQYPYPGHNGAVRAMGLELLHEAGIIVDNLPLNSYHAQEDLATQDEGRGYDDKRDWPSYRP